MYLTDFKPVGNDAGLSINEYLKDMHEIYDHSDYIVLFGADPNILFPHNRLFSSRVEQSVIGDEAPARTPQVK